MTERDRIRFGDTTIEYELRRSERRKKTVQISVDGGGVQVAAPTTTPADELRAIVRKRAAWILSHASGELLEAAPKRFVSGETLPYLGRNVHMIFEPADVRSPEVRFNHWRFHITVPQDLDAAERYEPVRRAIVGWYRARADQRIAASVDRWWPRLGQGERSKILIRDQRQRWGSCAPDGTLRFNWRANDAPTRADRVRHRPRVGAPDGQEPLSRLLGTSVQSHARCPTQAQKPAGGWTNAAPVMPASDA